MTPSLRIPASATLVAIALLVSPSRSDAQFGGLVNKAKDKMAEKGAEKAAPVSPGEQLTDDLLGKVLAGAAAGDRVLADRDAAMSQRDAKNKELSALVESNAPVHASYNQANDKILGCRETAFDTRKKAMSDRMNARVKAMQADPAMMGKVQLAAMKYARAMAEAQKKNDPVALQQAQTAYMADVTGLDVFAEMKKDTVAADAQCGRAPALPASLVQEEKLRSDISDLDGTIRTLEAKAIVQGAQAAGMDQLRYLQLKERALSISQKASTGSGAKFGDDEMAAVKKRQGDIDRLKRAM